MGHNIDNHPDTNSAYLSQMYTKAFLLGLVSLAAAKPEDDYEHRPHEYCEHLCRENRECREGKHGSYCKLDHHPRTCFGFYHKKHYEHGEEKHPRYCFQPNDKNCDDHKLAPVLCRK